MEHRLSEYREAVESGSVLPKSLGLGAADSHRADTLDIELLRRLEANLTEWDSSEDDDAYRDL